MTSDLREVERCLRAEDSTGTLRAVSDLVMDDRDALHRLLARSAGAGSPVAAEVLLAEVEPVVRRFVGGMLLDADAVDDVCQDVLISVGESVRTYRGDSRVSTWLHTIARHRVTDHLRRQRATTELPDDDASPAHRMSSMIATRATVQQALAALPELYRVPVTLRDLQGLPYAEIAERLGRAEGTVKAQISRGRALLAASLQAPRVSGSA